MRGPWSRERPALPDMGQALRPDSRAGGQLAHVRSDEGEALARTATWLPESFPGNVSVFVCPRVSPCLPSLWAAVSLCLWATGRALQGRKYLFNLSTSACSAFWI